MSRVPINVSTTELGGIYLSTTDGQTAMDVITDVATQVDSELLERLRNAIHEGQWSKVDELENHIGWRILKIARLSNDEAIALAHALLAVAGAKVVSA